MGRRPRSRHVTQVPEIRYFKPPGVPLRVLAEVRLGVDELEAMRLADVEGLDHADASERMDVSRQTFGRIIHAGRHKVALALTEGKAIRIEGGPFQLTQPPRSSTTAINGERSDIVKIAIAADGADLSARVGQRFGRTRQFVIYDVAAGTFEMLDNAPSADASQGAGTGAAQRVGRAGVQAVLVGHCGPKAFRALSEGGIAVYANVEGSVSDAVAAFRSGQLTPTDGADVDSHW